MDKINRKQHVINMHVYNLLISNDAAGFLLNLWGCDRRQVDLNFDPPLPQRGPATDGQTLVKEVGSSL